MALITCYECGAEISDMAKSCPKCGAPSKKARPDMIQSFTPWSRFYIVLAIILGFMGYLKVEVGGFHRPHYSNAIFCAIFAFILRWRFMRQFKNNPNDSDSDAQNSKEIIKLIEQIKDEIEQEIEEEDI